MIIEALDTIDTRLARLGIVLGLVMAGISSLRFGSLIFLGLGIAGVCFAYLVLVRRREKNRDVKKEGGLAWHTVKGLASVAFILLVIACLLLIFSPIYEIPIGFYFLISLCYVAVFCQVLLANERDLFRLSILALVQIAVISIVLRWAVYSQFPSIVGIDPWGNGAMLRDIVDTGHFPLYYPYSNTPVFPILGVEAMEFTGLGYKNCLFLYGGLGELLTFVFVFLVGKRLVGIRAGLTAGLFFSFYSSFVGFGTHSIIAMSIGITFFSILCFLLFLRETTRSLNWQILTLLILATIILTHVIVSIISLVLLLSFVLPEFYARAISRTWPRHRSSFITIGVIFSVAIIGYWMWVSGFFGYLVESLKYAFQLVQGEISPPVAVVERSSIYERVIENALALVTTLMIVFSSLFWLRKENRSFERTALLAFVLVTYGIAMYSSAFGLDAILPDRWWPFIYVAMAIFLAFGLVGLRSYFRGLAKATAVLLVVFLSFSMIVGSTSNVDSPIYASSSRLALTESEMYSSGFLSGIPENEVIVDLYFSMYWHFQLVKDVGAFNSSYFSENAPHDSRLKVLRTYCLENYFIAEVAGSGKRVGYSGDILFEGARFSHQVEFSGARIYDSQGLFIVAGY